MKSQDTAFFGHPAGLSTLFFTEMWERFSYYGMRAILILFLTAPLAAGGLGFPVMQAGAIYGTYVASVYLMTMAGGWMADKILGLRKAVFAGGVLIMLGHLSLAFPGMATFYGGLLLVVLGTGLLKGNISAIVGQLYRQDDTRRDAGFSLYYMGVNLGGFLGPIIVGALAQSEGFRARLAGWGMSPEAAWHFGFGAAAVGMFFGLLQYWLGGRRLPEQTLTPAGATNDADRAAARRKLGFAAVIVLAVSAIVYWMSQTGAISITPDLVSTCADVVMFGGAAAFFVWLFMGGDWTPAERKRLVVIFVLFLGATVFWAIFEQAGSTLNLFADRNTANTILSWQYPASWLQSVNSLFIVLFAPVVGAIWFRLGRKDPSSPAKFSLGLFFLVGAFGLMVAASMLAAGSGRVSPMWLIGCYFLQTIGELCLSPVGLSAMSKLAPDRVTGLMMGVWFLASSLGNKIAGRMGGLYESLSLPTLFGMNALLVLGFAVLMAFLIMPIKRMLAEGA